MVLFHCILVQDHLCFKHHVVQKWEHTFDDVMLAAQHCVYAVWAIKANYANCDENQVMLNITKNKCFITFTTYAIVGQWAEMGIAQHI